MIVDFFLMFHLLWSVFLILQVISLFRTASTDNVKMHCGRLKYSASFRKVRKMPTDYEKEEPVETPVPSTIVTPSDSQTASNVTPPPDMIEEALLAAPPSEDPDYGHRVSHTEDHSILDLLTYLFKFCI